ncbi:MAG: translocation/assembly module TamB domain-containing protein [Pseudomonadota bacterium]
MRKLVLISCLLFALAVLPAQALLSLLGIKNSMVEFLLDQISVEGELVVTAEEVVDPEDGVTAIRGLKVEDAQGVWLTVDSLNFAWNSSRLLRGEVEFSNLEAVGIRVLRQPVMPEGEPEPVDTSDPGSLIPKIAWPRSPLTLRIDRMALTDVAIAEPVLGHAISFNAVGAAQDEGDVQSARLDLDRTDAITGTIRFDYARNFADNTLRLNIDAAEAAGGLIADLGGLPMDAPSSLRLQADGPPQDWRAALDLSVAGLLRSDGTARIAYDGPLSVDTALALYPGAQLDPDFAALIGQRADLKAVATEGADGTIVIEQGQLSSPHVELTASGTFGRATGAADLALKLDAGPGLARPFDGVDFAGAGFDGTVVGVPGDLRADGVLTLSGLATAPADVVSASLMTAYRQGEAGGETVHTVNLEGQTTGLRLDKIAADVIGSAEIGVAVQAAGDQVQLETLWLDSGVLVASAAGEVDLETLNAELQLGISTPDLAPVAEAYGVEAQGAIQMHADVLRVDEQTQVKLDAALEDLAHELADAKTLSVAAVVRQSGDWLRFDIDGAGDALRLDRIDADLLPTANLSATGTLQDDTLELDLLKLSSPLMEASLKGSLDTGSGEGQFSYSVSTAELSPVARLYDQEAGGALSATGLAKLPARESATPPRLDGEVELQSLRYQGQSYGDLTLAHDVLASPTPSGTIDLRNTAGPYAPASIRTGFAVENPRVTLTDLDLSALGLSAKARDTVEIRTDAPSVDGTISIAARDLRRLRAVTGTALGGSVNGTVALSSNAGRQDAQMDLGIRNLSTDGAKIGSASLKGSARDLLGRPALDVTLTAGDIAAGTAEISGASLKAKGALSALDLIASAKGSVDSRAVSLSSTVRADLSGSSVGARVNTFEATLDKERFALAQPMRVAVSGSTVALKDIDLSMPDGASLRGALTSFGGPVSADLRLSAPRLGFLKRLADVPIASGSLDVQAAFDTRRGRESGSGQFAAQRLVFEDVELEGGLTAQGGFELRRGAADLNAEISGAFGDPMRLTAALPIVGGGPVPALATRGPVSAKIDWTGQIGDLWALVPAPGHVLSGDTVIDLGVSGDIADPKISGGVRVRDGGYQNLDLGTILTDLKIDTDLLPDGALGLDVMASDGAKGTVKTEGRIALDQSGLKIDTTIDSAILMRREDVTARTDGSVSIAGPMNALKVTGGIVIEEAEVRLVNNNPPSIVELDEVLIKGAPDPEQSDEDSSVTLDLTISSPGRMFVRGRGLDSEWKMDLAVRGNAAKPRISGSVDRVRGQLDLIGKAFELERGRIFFDGGASIDPIIDVMLTRETRDLTGRIVVDGSASDPNLSFRSTPALPEDEVLPRVLFGKSSQALTGSQAISLGIGLATLMDGSGGTIDSVRGAVGLDSLRLDQDEDGNTAVAAGKEVAEGVWVGTKQPLGEGGTSVVVEVEVFEDILLDTEIEAGGDASVGLEWKTDF